MYIQKQDIPDRKKTRKNREQEQYRRGKTMYLPKPNSMMNKREEGNLTLPWHRELHEKEYAGILASDDEMYWTGRQNDWRMECQKREQEQKQQINIKICKRESNVTLPLPTTRECCPKEYIDVGSDYREELKNQKKLVTKKENKEISLTKTRFVHFFTHFKRLEKERQKEKIEEHQEAIIEAEEYVAAFNNMPVDEYINEGKTRRRKPLTDPCLPIVDCPYCKFKARSTYKVAKHVMAIHLNEFEARTEVLPSKLKKPIKVSGDKRMTLSSEIIAEVHVEPTATDDSDNEEFYDVTDHSDNESFHDATYDPDNEVSTHEHNLNLELPASPLDLPTSPNNPIFSKESEKCIRTVDTQIDSAHDMSVEITTEERCLVNGDVNRLQKEGHGEGIDSVQILEVFYVTAAEDNTIRKIGDPAIAESNVKPVHKISVSLIWKNIKKVKIVNHILCTQCSI